MALAQAVCGYISQARQRHFATDIWRLRDDDDVCTTLIRQSDVVDYILQFQAHHAKDASFATAVICMGAETMHSDVQFDAVALIGLLERSRRFSVMFVFRRCLRNDMFLSLDIRRFSPVDTRGRVDKNDNSCIAAVESVDTPLSLGECALRSMMHIPLPSRVAIDLVIDGDATERTRGLRKTWDGVYVAQENLAIVLSIIFDGLEAEHTRQDAWRVASVCGVFQRSTAHGSFDSEVSRFLRFSGATRYFYEILYRPTARAAIMALLDNVDVVIAILTVHMLDNEPLPVVRNTEPEKKEST